MHEIMSLAEWCERHPRIRTVLEEQQDGFFDVPAFNLWPDAESIDGISDHQREQIGKAMLGRIGILGGSPGTGKTFSVGRLIQTLIDSGRCGAHEIAVCAPTGKAAVRLNEIFSSPNLSLSVRARTIHSTLGVGSASSETGSWGFQHNENCPLPHKVLIVDETSMVDLPLLRALLSARQPGCHVLLIGDINQLPPVGVGAPLRDLIAAGIPYGELTEIQRNSGGIVEACAAIRDQKPWLHLANDPSGNLKLVERRGAEQKLAAIDSLLLKIRGENRDISIYDLQVLVAVNERSELGRKKLNVRLQDLLNESSKVQGTIFRIGDKVVCLKNGWYDSCAAILDDEDITTNDAGQVYVANGDLGQVLRIDGGRMEVELTSPRRIVAVPLGKQPGGGTDDGDDADRKSDDESDKPAATGCNWDLGYALSVHKAQGSEAKFVIVVLDDYSGASMICDRSWIYTGISRAKSQCFLVGEPELATRFCRVQKVGKRKTFLREKILQLMAQREMSEL